MTCSADRYQWFCADRNEVQSAVIQRRISQLALTGITHQVARAFDLNLCGKQLQEKQEHGEQSSSGSEGKDFAWRSYFLGHSLLN